MQNICFNIATMHQHGNAFYEFLKLRKRLFVDSLGWDIPHDHVVEMDQYDNPSAYYSLVLSGGQVIGGARTMPVDASWGANSSMLKDAMAGRIDGIPSDLIKGHLDTPSCWECTRLVIAESVRSAEDRTRCLSLIVDGLNKIAVDHGATTLISLSPGPLLRSLRRLGHDVVQIGSNYRCASDGRMYTILSMPTQDARSKQDTDAGRARLVS